ncbi:isochorismatase family cysteine hydrolase [Sulfurimonas sp. HSL3-7]|uniref:cysteine hydrolase family protein n=1 Tax=Sulfonitrofixus jiaomeiensis TaxID=3131938 RepID=UPI0031F93C76
MNKYTKPNFETSALITIDTQRDTLEGQPLEIKGTSDALPRMKILLDFYRKNQLPIIHIVRIYKPDGSNVDLCRKELVENGAALLAEDSIGAELARELFDNDSVRYNTKLLLEGGIQKISDNEVIIYKPRWGAFYNTPLDDYLKSLNVNTLVFSGCNFPNCPRTSIYEASERDYKVVLAEDALSGLYEQGIKELENIDVLVETTVNIIKKANV